ncbi:MAG: carbohydrate deacetylase [Terriglobales bacterium]
MPVQIIVNADDLGMNAEVNEAIFHAMENGVITSATILSNGPAVVPAARMLRRFPQCSFGVHLNLTELQPLCRESYTALSGILNEHNCFNGNAIREVSISAPMLRAIYREWCAQIDNLVQLGVQPSHLDAHHHVHTIPQMLPVLAALRRRYRINKARISRNLYDPAEPASKVLLAKKWFYNQALRCIGFKTTRIFTDLEAFIKVCAARPPQGRLIELMTHPGSLLSSEEPGLLASDWTKKLSYPVALVSYNAL